MSIPMNKRDLITAEIKARIVDLILSSQLNIQALDDKSEEVLWTNILDVVEKHVVSESCWNRAVKIVMTLWSKVKLS